MTAADQSASSSAEADGLLSWRGPCARCAWRRFRGPSKTRRDGQHNRKREGSDQELAATYLPRVDWIVDGKPQGIDVGLSAVRGDMTPADYAVAVEQKQGLLSGHAVASGNIVVTVEVRKQRKANLLTFVGLKVAPTIVARDVDNLPTAGHVTQQRVVGREKMRTSGIPAIREKGQQHRGTAQHGQRDLAAAGNASREIGGGSSDDDGIMRRKSHHTAAKTRSKRIKMRIVARLPLSHECLRSIRRELPGIRVTRRSRRA